MGRGVTRATAIAEQDPVLAVGVGAKAISASAEYLERIGELTAAPQDLTRAALKAAADILRAYLHGLEAGLSSRADLVAPLRRTLARLTGDQRWTDIVIEPASAPAPSTQAEGTGMGRDP